VRRTGRAKKRPPRAGPPAFCRSVLAEGKLAAAAGDKYVNVLGAEVARQCLEAGVLDEILVCIAPVLLGDGVRLFGRPGGPSVKLERLSLTQAPLATNLWLRVAERKTSGHAWPSRLGRSARGERASRHTGEALRSLMAELVEAGMLSYWLVRRRQRAVRRHLRGRVLDFGCGVGTLAEICDPADYVGVDIDPRKIEIARRDRPRYRFETAVPEAERFDTVAALAFVEHVRDPAGYLRRFAGLLNAGGQVVLTTPHPSLEWVHTTGARIGLFSHAAHDEHEDLIDRRRMAELLAGTGMGLAVYRRFLFGANQLFVVTSRARAAAPDR